MRRLLWLSVALALVIAYPLLFSTPFQQRLGALVLLYAIAASAWNIVGGYAGQVSVGHVVFFGCGAYAAMGAYAHFALSPMVGIPAGILFSVLIAAVVGVPTLRLSGHYFSMATIAVAELVRLIVTNTEYLGAAGYDGWRQGKARLLTAPPHNDWHCSTFNLKSKKKMCVMSTL